jgi:hypothetical protein
VFRGFLGDRYAVLVSLFSALSEADVDVIISLLVLVATVLQRDESVPGIPVPVVVQLLRWPDETHRNAVRLSVARVLSLLAQRHQYQHLLIDSRVMEEFAEVFATAAFDVKQEIATCVATLVRYGNTTIRLDVIEKKGVPILIEGLGSGQSNVVLEVVNALTCLVQAGRRQQLGLGAVGLARRLD